MEYTLQEIYDHYFELSEEERLSRAKEAAEKLNKNDIIVQALFAHFIAADYKISKRELDIYNAIFEKDIASLEEFVEEIQTLRKRCPLDTVDFMIDRLDADSKNEACIVCLSIITDDNEIHDRENDFFEKILRA